MYEGFLKEILRAMKWRVLGALSKESKPFYLFILPLQLKKNLYNYQYQYLLRCHTSIFNNAQNMKFSFKDFFSFLWIWSHLLVEILNGKLHFLCSAQLLKS